MKSKRRILIVAPELPHAPLTGAHTRPLSVISALAALYDVVVVGAAPKDADVRALQASGVGVRRLDQRPYQRSSLRMALARSRSMLTPVPLLSNSRFESMARLVDEAVRAWDPDVLHLVGMYSCWYRDERRPAVIDLPDVISGLCDSAVHAHPVRYRLAGWQRSATERVEQRELRKMAAVIAINDEDAERLRRLGVESSVVPLAVPAATIASTAVAGGRDRGLSGSADFLRLLFVGNMLHHPNRAAARFILDKLVPQLRRRSLRFTLTIAGRAAGSVVNHPVDDVVSFVSDAPDLGPLYASADVAIIPIAFGGGTKNKTLEAMTWGLPVVGTAQAFTGLEKLDGEAYLTVPLDAAAMADVLVRLSRDQSRRMSLGDRAREHVLRHHTQQVVEERLRFVYDGVLA